MSIPEKLDSVSTADFIKLDATERQAKQKQSLEQLIGIGHQYISRIADTYKPRLLFTENGLSRLCHIIGYISGLSHAGLSDQAYALMRDFGVCLKYLGNESDDFDFTIHGKILTIPGRKCLLSDDGTWHGFGLRWYRPVSIEQFERIEEELRSAYEAGRPPGNTDYFDARAAAIRVLNIREFVEHNNSSAELTEYRYADRNQVKVYYTQCMTGGFIYHGPGAGETFTVSLGNKDQFWGIHT